MLVQRSKDDTRRRRQVQTPLSPVLIGACPTVLSAQQHGFLYSAAPQVYMRAVPCQIPMQKLVPNSQHGEQNMGGRIQSPASEKNRILDDASRDFSSKIIGGDIHNFTGLSLLNSTYVISVLNDWAFKCVRKAFQLREFNVPVQTQQNMSTECIKYLSKYQSNPVIASLREHIIILRNLDPSINRFHLLDTFESFGKIFHANGTSDFKKHIITDTDFTFACISFLLLLCYNSITLVWSNTILIWLYLLF